MSIMAERKTKQLAKINLQNASESKELRKSNEAIGLRVKKGNFSLLSRKVFNVLVYHAQQLKVPGQNAPIDSEANRKYYWLPLSELARDAAYDSNDTLRLKNHLEELLNIRIVTEDDVQWTSQRLLAAFTLVNPSGLNVKGGQLWLGFTFPPEVESRVMNPDSYTKLAFLYQSMFRRGTSLSLYEICRRYLTNPSKVTQRRPWEWWFEALTGNPINGVLPEYKIAKRDTFKGAIAEVNSATDINIEMIEHKAGRKVMDLQFRVVESAQAKLNFPAPPVIDTEVLTRVMNFGLNQKDASDIVASTDEATLMATIKLVEDRQNNKKLANLASPAAYFKQALKDKYANPLQIAKIGEKKKKKPGSVETPVELTERYMSHRAREAYNTYLELPDADRDTVLEDFKKESRMALSVKKSGLMSAAFRHEFSHWYAMRVWANPSQEDLLQFAISFPKSANVV